MQKVSLVILILIFMVSDSFALVASDIDPTNAFEQISLIVASIVAFLVFILGARRVLNFLGWFMKKIFYIFILSLIFSSNIYAYVNMSKVNKRAKDLGMRTKDYAYSMAISGALCGSMFGLFLWKSR